MLSWILAVFVFLLGAKAFTKDGLPVSQVDFMRSLRRTLRVPIGLPATEAMVRFGARWILGTDPELALYGRYVLPQRLIDSGFSFEFPDLDSALHDLR